MSDIGAVLFIILAFPVVIIILAFYAYQRAEERRIAEARERQRRIAELQREKQRKIANSDINQIDAMTGREFAEFLNSLFSNRGYIAGMKPTFITEANRKFRNFVGESADLKPVSGAYGADLILSRNGQVIAVHAKRCNGDLGFLEVNAAHRSTSYYHAHEAWIVTNSHFTPVAAKLAKKCAIRLIDREDLITLISQAPTRKL